MAEKGMIIVIVMPGLASVASPQFEWHFRWQATGSKGLLSVVREPPTPRRNASQPFHSRSCTAAVIA
jgi:hypothetical protein